MAMFGLVIVTPSFVLTVTRVMSSFTETDPVLNISFVWVSVVSTSVGEFGVTVIGSNSDSL